MTMETPNYQKRQIMGLTGRFDEISEGHHRLFQGLNGLSIHSTGPLDLTAFPAGDVPSFGPSTDLWAPCPRVNHKSAV